MNETELRKRLQVTASERGWHLFRNNVGVGWAGEVMFNRAGSVTLDRARIFRAGLCVGSSDLIGWRPVTVVPEMVGQTYALFVAREVKIGNEKPSQAQAAFLRAVTKDGGDGKVVGSVDEL